MPINDLIPELLDLLTSPGGNSRTSLQAVINPDNDLNRGFTNYNRFQSIQPGQLTGQTPNEILDLLTFKPRFEPKPPSILNLAPDAVSVGGLGGNQGGFSQVPQRGGLDNLLSLVLNTTIPGVEEETGITGNRGGGRGGNRSSVGGTAGSVIGNIIGRALFPEISAIPFVGEGIGRIIGSITGGLFGGGVSHRVTAPQLEIPENLSGFDIVNHPIHASSYRHGWERIAPIIDSLHETQNRIFELFRDQGFSPPAEFFKDMPHTITATKGSQFGLSGMQLGNQQSVALMSAAMSIYKQLLSEVNSDEKPFTDIYNNNPSIEALFRLRR